MSVAKSVLVTGGTKRIGKAIADCLRTRGWNVVTSSHRADAGADVVADLAEPMGPARLYAAACERAGGTLDAIVNNAGLFVGEKAALEAVNLEAPKKLTMMLAGKEDARGAVVNVVDAKALVGGEPATDYLATKAGLVAYTRKSACLFADTLRVNAVAPGPVLAPTEVHEPAGETLLERRPTAEDVAEAVAYLLEAEATTGAVIPVDAGQHLAEWGGLSSGPHPAAYLL